MKPNKHLTGLFDRLIEDQTMHPTYISLYFSLFQYWNINRFQNPISITREEMMLISKIGSRATYHKCMRELNDKGYIKYDPTFNPFKGSSVQLFNFSEIEPPKNKKQTQKILNQKEEDKLDPLLSSAISIPNKILSST